MSALGHKPTYAVQQPMSALPPIAHSYICFAPKSGHVRCKPSCLLWANSGHCTIYSITSSARPIKGSGIFNPSAFAVLRLMIIATLATS